MPYQCKAMAAWNLVRRVLVSASSRPQRQQLCVSPTPSPFGFAPMGLAVLSGYRGDIALARAAYEAGIQLHTARPSFRSARVGNEDTTYRKVCLT